MFTDEEWELAAASEKWESMRRVQRQLSEPISIDFRGFFVPTMTNKEPCLVMLRDSYECFAIVFSTSAKCEESCAKFGIRNYKIVTVTDGQEFADSVFESHVRIMVDPYFIGEKTRWREII